MKRKPTPRRKPTGYLEGAKYRNLHLRRNRSGKEIIYYERCIGKRRIKLSTKTNDRDTAAAFRDAYEHKKGIGVRSLPLLLRAPTFAEAAERYLKEAAGHLAGSTREDRESMLGEAGRLTRYFGPMRLDRIDRPALLTWWASEVEGKGRSHNTGLNYLNALAGVLGYAVDLEQIAENPVDALRATLRRRRRSKRGREEAEAGRHVHPIERLGDLRAFVRASACAGTARFRNGRPKVQRRDGHIADMLQLDAGLRMGEVTALRWRHVDFASGPDDRRRHLRIEGSVSRGRHEGPPKSGRARTVKLSRRLRTLLRDHWIATGQAGADTRVLPSFNARNYADRHFAEVCRAAELEGYTPKDLRDTYASQLLTAGVPLAYVSKQLGHRNSTVTAEHYAKWVDPGEGDDDYREPMRLRPGDVPADFLARLMEEDEATAAVAL
jgi:integrase